MKNSYGSPKQSNRIWSGLILLLIGLYFLSRNFGFFLPWWLFSWHVILMVVGLVAGAKKNFRGGGWLVMVVVGGFFTLQRFTHLDMGDYYFPGIFILIGVYLILSSVTRQKKMPFFGEQPNGSGPGYAGPNNTNPNGFNTTGSTETPSQDPAFTAAGETVNSGAESSAGSETYTEYTTGRSKAFNGDTIDLVNVFSGSKQQIYSKNLLGGEIVAVFGGCDLNFIQADFQQEIVLEITAIFGGVKLIIPPNWIVKADITPIFGGMNDSRTVLNHTQENSKVLIVKGLALFGGIDIKNF